MEKVKEHEWYKEHVYAGRGNTRLDETKTKRDREQQGVSNVRNEGFGTGSGAAAAADGAGTCGAAPPVDAEDVPASPVGVPDAWRWCL
jgi:hypothetical protein